MPRKFAALGLAGLAVIGLATADVRPQFERSTEPEVVPSTPIRDFTIPFFSWAPNDEVGFLGPGGLYDDDGAPKMGRNCGKRVIDGASPTTVDEGELYALLGEDGRICVFEGTNAAAVTEVRAKATSLAFGLADVKDAGGAISTIPMIVGTRGGAAFAVNARSGKSLWTRDPDLGALHASAASAAGAVYAVGGERGAAVLHGTSGRLVRAVSTARRGAAEDPVYAVALDREGKRLLTGQGGGRVSVWTLATGRIERTLDLGEGDVVDVAWSRDEEQITAVSRISEASGARIEFEVWDLVDDLPAFRESVPAPHGALTRPRLRVAPWGITLVGSDGAGFTRVWQRPSRFNMPSGPPLREIPHHRRVRGVTSPVSYSTVSDDLGDTLSPAGRWPAPPLRERLATDAEGNSVWVDVATRLDLKIHNPDGSVRARHALSKPAFSASVAGDRLLVIAEDGSVRGAARAGTALAVQKDMAGVSAIATGASPGVVWGSRSGDVTFTAPGEEPRVYAVHAGPVVALASSADGKHAVTVGPRFRDAGTTDPIPTLGVSLLLRDPASRGTIQSDAIGGSQAFTWVVDGRTATVSLAEDLALVRTDLEVVVLDLRRGGRLLTLPYVARDAVLGPARTVRWIDPTGRERKTAISESRQQERPRGRPLCESQNRRGVATLDADVLVLWNGHQGRQGETLPQTGGQILACAFDEDATKVAVLQADGRFDVWSVDRTTALAGVSDQDAEHPWFAFAPVVREEDSVAARPLQGTAADRAKEFVQHGQLTFDENGPGAVWVRRDARHVDQIELAVGAVVESVELPIGVRDLDGRSGRFATLKGAGGQVLGYLDMRAGSVSRRVWAPETQPLAAHKDRFAWVEAGQLRVGPLGGPAEASALPGGRPVAAAMTPDGKALAFADDHNRVVVITLPFREVRVLDPGTPPSATPTDPLIERLWFGGQSLGHFAREQALVSRDASGTLRSWLWVAGGGSSLVARAPGPIAAVPWIHALAASPDGRTLYSGQEDTLIRAWDIEKAVQRTAFMGPVGPIHAIAPTKDGKTVIVGSADGTVRMYDAATKVDSRWFLTFGETTVALALGEEDGGTKLASMSDAGTLRVWDLQSGKPVVHWTVRPVAGVLTLRWMPGLGRLSLLLGGLDWRLPLDADEPSGGEPTELQKAPSFMGNPVHWVKLKPGRLASTDDLGRIVLWDEASELPYARLTLLSDGSWISDRIDGVQLAGESLRDGTSLLLYGYGGQMEPNTREVVDAFVKLAIEEQTPAVQECLAGAPTTLAGSAIGLKWVISAGTVRRIAVTSDTTQNDGLVGCLVDVIQGLRFDLEVDAAEMKREWVVAGGAVRALRLSDQDVSPTLSAVETVLTGSLARLPKGCIDKRVHGEAVLAWVVDAGKVQGLSLLDGSTVPATVAACVSGATVGTRVEGVERASGVWVTNF